MSGDVEGTLEPGELSLHAGVWGEVLSTAAQKWRDRAQESHELKTLAERFELAAQALRGRPTLAPEPSREPDERVRRFLQAVGEYAIAMVDPDGRVVGFSKGAERLTGVSASELLGRPLSLEGLDDGQLAAGLERTKREDRALLTFTLTRGTPHVVELELTALRGEGAALFGFALSLKDKRAEAVIERSEERAREADWRLRAVVETAVDGIVTINERGIIETVNTATLRIFGYSREELIGQNVKMLMPEPYRSEHDQYLGNYLHTNEPKVIGIGREVTGRRKDGSTMPVDLAVSETRVAGGRVFTGIVRDITERKQAAEKLRRSEERFRLLLENVHEYALVLLDPDGQVSLWNVGAQRLLGYTEEEAHRLHLRDFVSPEARQSGEVEDALETALREGVSTREGWTMRRGGDCFWGDVALTALRDPAGQPLGFALIAHDLTERRRGEEEIRTLNAALEQKVIDRTSELLTVNKELEAFCYSVSHDLRAPLRGIDGFSKLLLERYRDRLDGQGVHYLSRVRAATQRMSALIDDLLKLSRISRAEIRSIRVDLSALAREIADEIARREPARKVTWSIQPKLFTVGDPALLRAMLENLLQNAWKFTGKKESAHVEVGSQEVDGSVAFFVRDNGAGFEMEYVNKLFTPFQRLHDQTEFEGTGIGLATVQRIITRHRGRVWATGKPGEGATVFFVLNEGGADESE